LWALAVPPKLAFFWLTSSSIIGHLKQGLSYPLFIAAAGLFVGIVSSAFEVGVTFLAKLDIQSGQCQVFQVNEYRLEIRRPAVSRRHSGRASRLSQ
jgi:hypothetical protein